MSTKDKPIDNGSDLRKDARGSATLQIPLSSLTFILKPFASLNGTTGLYWYIDI